MSDPASEESSAPEDGIPPEDAWNPPGPIELVINNLTKTELRRYTSFNFLLFFVIALGFGLPFVLQYIAAGFDSPAATAGATASTAGVIFGAFLIAIMLAPMIGGISGAITGIQADFSPMAAGTVAGGGSLVGFVGLFVLLFAIGMLPNIDPNPVRSASVDTPFYPVTMAVGTAIAGFGAAYLSAGFLR